MAAVSQIYTLEFYIEDAKREYSIISIFIGSEAGEIDISKLIDAATVFYGYLAPLVNGQIRHASARIELLQFEGTPTSGSKVELGAVFVAVSIEAPGQRRILIRFPSFNQTLTTSGTSIKVNNAHASVAPLMEAMRLGFTVSGTPWKFVVDTGYPFSSAVQPVGAMDYQKNASRRRR